jgi:hypothetical protein
VIRAFHETIQQWLVLAGVDLSVPVAVWLCMCTMGVRQPLSEMAREWDKLAGQLLHPQRPGCHNQVCSADNFWCFICVFDSGCDCVQAGQPPSYCTMRHRLTLGLPCLLDVLLFPPGYDRTESDCMCKPINPSCCTMRHCLTLGFACPIAFLLLSIQAMMELGATVCKPLNPFRIINHISSWCTVCWRSSYMPSDEPGASAATRP